MGHREDLLAAAKRCLYEKGYARTTARDLVAASGTNLASIGYHYGSKEALLNAALIDAFQELGEEFDRDRPPEEVHAEAVTDPIGQLELTWAQTIESFRDRHRPLWMASFEALAQVERSDEVREKFARLHEDLRADLAQLIPGSADLTQGQARAVGSFMVAIMAGLTVQWLIDPDHAPSAEEMAFALRTIVDAANTAASSTTTHEPPKPPWLHLLDEAEAAEKSRTD